MIREPILLSYVKGKDVLDIGSIGQDMDILTRELIRDKPMEESDKYFLWNQLKQNAKSLTGIDTEPSKDPSVIQGNMETHSFGRSFDIVIAGDVLEHVDNQGLFLRNIHKHLKDDGRFIVTTPNCKWFTVILKPNPTHTLWHDPYTLKVILDRCGFEIERFEYYPGNKPYYNWIKRILTWHQSMLLVCKKKGAPGAH